MAEANCVRQTKDGGYILAGTKITYYQIDSTKSAEKAVWLIKTDDNGDKTWSKSFRKFGDATGRSVMVTYDGNYVVAGDTKYDDVLDSDSDIWLIKTTNTGDRLWDKTFGGLDDDEGYSVQQTGDDGYIIAGSTESFGAGDSDLWLVKTAADGSEQWNRCFGGTDYDSGESARLTSDGGFIIVGRTRSYGAGDSDFYLVKTDTG
jgi:hypothetical protein